MSRKRAWQFWVTLIVGMVVIPLASVALSYGLGNSSRARALEEELATQRTAMISNIAASQLADLRGALVEIYARLGPDSLPNAYWEAVDQARSARLELVNDNPAKASELIASAYEKVYAITLPLGPPLIHEEPIEIITNL
jgi:hypothetical protein